MQLDADGTILESNRGISGLDRPELEGVSLWHLVPNDEQAMVRSAVHHAAHPGIVQDIEVELVTQGTSRRHRLLLIPMMVDQKTRAILCQWTDIDVQSREMERLRRSEKMMRDNEGMTHVGTWYWDVSKPHAEWSPELYDIYGLDPATHVPTYEDYLERVHPDDRERVRKATEAVFNDHEPYSHDERVRHTDGSWRDLHTWAAAVTDDEGNLIGLQGVCQDITAQKVAEKGLLESESKFRAIFDSAGVGIGLLDESGRLVEYNQALAEVLDLEEARIDRQELARLLDHDLAPVFKQVQKTQSPQEVRIWLSDQQHILLTVTQALDAGRGTWVVVLRDITSETLARQAKERVGELEKEASDRAKFIGMASHEIKNPLTPIRLQLAMLRAGRLGDLAPMQARAVEIIDEQVRRVSTLTHDLLDSTRLASGMFGLQKARHDLARITRAVVEEYEDVAQDQKVALDLEAQPSVAEVDESRVAQAIANVVSNAIRHATKRVMIRVSAGEIRIEDDGAGMDAEAAQNVFRPFQTTVSGGTGLGLYITKGLVEAHGGSIEVSSEPGAGTQVVIRLPMAERPIST